MTLIFILVYNASLGRLYQAILKKQNRNFNVVYNLDGFDEISLTDHFILRTNTSTSTIAPEDLGLPNYKAEDLFGGEDIASNAKVFMDVLSNKSTKAQKDVVAANAGFGIQLYKENITVQEGIQQAIEAIESGAALNNFKKLLN